MRYNKRNVLSKDYLNSAVDNILAMFFKPKEPTEEGLKQLDDTEIESTLGEGIQNSQNVRTFPLPDQIGIK